jgi:hypothetical protein
MLPYLRLGYISDPDEMQSILSSEGDTCPVSMLSLLSDIVSYCSVKLLDLWLGATETYLTHAKDCMECYFKV